MGEIPHISVPTTLCIIFFTLWLSSTYWYVLYRFSTYWVRTHTVGTTGIVCTTGLLFVSSQYLSIKFPNYMHAHKATLYYEE
jgi:hypothetical protein